jgi:microcystin-dependent protein
MADPYVGEIRLFAGNFAPQGWALCEGQLLPILGYETLFTLIGTTYGGDGQNSFALPDLQGRVPIHQGAGAGLSNRIMGERGGAETVTLTASQLPAHNHPLVATSAAAQAAAVPSGSVLAATPVSLYGTAMATAPMASTALAAAGGAQPHENMAPFVAMNYIIALIGIFPSQN